MTKADPQNLTAQYDLAAATLRLGIVDTPASGLPDALDALRQAARILESLVSASPNETRYKAQLAIAQEYIGHRLRDLGRPAESIAAFGQSLAGAKAMLAADGASRTAYVQMLAARRGLVLSLAASGDRAEMLTQAQTAIDEARGFGARFPDKKAAALYLAKSWLALASAHRIFARSASQPGQAESDWREVRTAAERAIQEISAISGLSEDPYFSPSLVDARRLIGESGGHSIP
jgi:tetratricopeptide (TPR) repeat protein